MPRALLVSWLFPPHASVGAKRAYRFARYLPGHGWDVTVLCGREPPSRMRDPTPRELPPGVRVVADYDPAWLTRLANRADAAAAQRARAAAHPPTVRTDRDASAALQRPALVRALGALARDAQHALPTETIAVHLPHALATARRIVRDAPSIAAVWTTSYPYSAHLIGVALARARGLPFVADLRDPWTPSFVHAGKPAATRWAERRLEAWVFAHAARITVTTEALADAYRARYPALADRFVAIRNGFDPALALPARPARAVGRPVRLVHFGHVYGERTLRPLLAALARLRDAGTLAPGDLVLENYGRLADEDRACADALGLGAFIAVRDPVPYREGLARLSTADLLVLLAWGTDAGPLFLPAKLYDYLLAGGPILAIGDNPELAGILAHTRAGVLRAPDDTAGLADALAAAASRTLPHAPDARAVASYSAERGAAQLAAVFDAVTRPRGPSAEATGATGGAPAPSPPREP